MDNDIYRRTVESFLRLFRYLRCYSKNVSEYGLSGRKIALLKFLAESGPATVGALRDFLFIEDSTASEMTASLEKEGFVLKVRSQEDSRVVLVSLTENGRRLVERVPLGGIPLLRKRLKDLPRGKLLEYTACFEELCGLLEIMDRKSDGC